MRNFGDKHVDGICDGFVPLLLRNLGMSHFWSALPGFRTHHYSLETAAGILTDQREWEFGNRLSDMTAEQSMTWS